MTETVGAQNSVKMPKYKKYGTTGALIGGAVGAAAQLAWVKALMPKQLTEDQFVKQNLGQSIFYTDYKDYVKDFEKLKGEIKKTLPSSVAKSAAAFAVVGAAIGAVVYLIKKSKANKANQAPQQSSQADTKA